MLVPGVRYFPKSLPNADSQLARLLTEIEWDHRMHARRTASFGVPYNYSGQAYPAAPMPHMVAEIAETAATIAGHAFNNCLCNLYESGSNTMGFHSDSYAELVPLSWIAIASLGATRTLVFRSADRVQRVEHELEHGSILLMNRETQQGWTHAIERSPIAEPRISLTFRQFRDA